MTGKTHVHDARTRVEREQAAVEAKLDAVERFRDRVADCTPAPSPSAAAGHAATAGTVAQGRRPTGDGCQAVRRAFAETVRPHSLDDVAETESLLETIRAELSDSLALALAPTTDATFTPRLKRAVLSAAEDRRAETEVVLDALEREASQLAEARTAVEEIVAWLVTVDETPLTDLGFEELRHRHDALAVHRQRCQELAEQRQSFRDSVVQNGPGVGLRASSLVPYVYRDFPVDHPVLATVARLDETCAACQRAVRRHLVGRA